MHPAEKIKSRSKRFDGNFLWMQNKFQFFLEKVVDVAFQYPAGFGIVSANFELIIRASYSDRAEKLISLSNGSFKLDLLKFFLQISWDVKSLDNKKYILLSEKLDEIGKMLGGWIRSIK